MPARGEQREAPDIMAALRTSWRPYVLERPHTRAGVGLRSALPGCLAAWLGETCAARRVTVEEVLREVGVAAEDPRARRGRAVGPRCAHLRVAQAGGGAGRGWAREGVGGQGGGCGGCVPSCRKTARTAYAPHTLRTHPRLLYP